MIIANGVSQYLMHRVQWMQRVMMVFTRGPMFLSSTALKSTNMCIYIYIYIYMYICMCVYLHVLLMDTLKF